MMKLSTNRRTSMRSAVLVLSLLLCPLGTAAAQVSVSIGLPDVSIGINLPVYPQLVLVPGYPVYYAPQVNSNYFFYDGMYWVYQQDNWYASSWYNGPWALVSEYAVPLFILRIPVRYYRRPPVYFHGWSSNAPPHWGDHWGNTWEQRRSGWDNWNHHSVPHAAPLPVYQRQYSGSRYPRVEQQQVLQRKDYHYQPRDASVKKVYQTQRTQSGTTASRRQAPQPESAEVREPATAHATPEQNDHAQKQSQAQKKDHTQASERHAKREPAAQPAPEQSTPAVAQRGPPAARSRTEEKHPQPQAKQAEEKQPEPQAKQAEEKHPQPQAKRGEKEHPQSQAKRDEEKHPQQQAKRGEEKHSQQAKHDEDKNSEKGG